jgi:sigma-B regulation protein RsbU (phosphoserine phosphatase)
MKYRWKLLILLMTFSIVPIIALRTFGIHNVHKMAESIVIQVKKFHSVNEQDQTSGAILDTIRRHVAGIESLSAGFLIFLVLVATFLAFAFSRTVTKPLEALAHAAQKLAGGDFQTRVTINSKDEFGDMGRIFNSVGPRLEAHYRMRQSLDVANEIQQHLLPESPPICSGLDVDGIALYSDETGGDYFDYLCKEKQESLGVVVGDVADHGIPSALLMATVRAFLRLRASMPGSPGDIVSDVNRAFANDVEKSGRFMTLFLAQIDPGRNRMLWVNAGHEPAIIYDPAGVTFKNLKGNGMPLGVNEDATYKEISTEIRPGQLIFIGTDGIRETRNQDDEMFGNQRLQKILRRHANASARTVKRAILDAVAEFRGNQAQEDDLTLVVIKVTDGQIRS